MDGETRKEGSRGPDNKEYEWIRGGVERSDKYIYTKKSTEW